MLERSMKSGFSEDKISYAANRVGIRDFPGVEEEGMQLKLMKKRVRS